MIFINKDSRWQSITIGDAAEISASWIMQIDDNNIYLITTYEPELKATEKWWWPHGSYFAYKSIRRWLVYWITGTDREWGKR